MFDFSGWEIGALYGRMGELEVAEEAIRVEKVAVARAIETLRAASGRVEDRTGKALASETGIEPKRARQIVGLALGLESLPEIARALEAGEISVDVAAEVVKFATPEEDSDLADKAKSWTPSQAETIRRKRAEISEAEARTLHRARMFSWYYDKDRRHVNFRGLLPTAEAEVLISAIETELARADKAKAGAIDAAEYESRCCGNAVLDAEGEETRSGANVANKNGSSDRSGPSPREAYKNRCADALVNLIGSVDVTKDSSSARAQVLIVTSVDELAGKSGAIAVGSGFSSVEVARRLACDSALEVVLTDKSGRPKAIGANTRVVPPKLSRLIRGRDKTCRFPGCGDDRFIQIHHVIHYSKGGPTVEDNLVALCWSHHHLVHEGGWEMSGSASSGLVISSPYGQRYECGPLVFDLARAG